MKRQRLDLRSGMLVERGRDWNGYFYIACAKGASVFIRDEKELRRFLKLPKGTPSRELLDAFLAEAQPRANDEGEEKREELLATGFGPECHLDESDPNHNTRTVI